MKSMSILDWTVPNTALFLLSYLGFGYGELKSATVLDVTGPRDGSGVLFRSGNDGQWIAQAWGFDEALKDVSISADVTLDGVVGTAWLTNAIGGSATATNILKSESFNSPGSGTVTFFSDLDLQPGPYFFLITVDSGIGGWTIAFPRTVSTDFGVNYGGFFFANSSNAPLDFNLPPASSWMFGGDNLQFRITGSAVPEPSILILLGIGLSVVVGAQFVKHASPSLTG